MKAKVLVDCVVTKYDVQNFKMIYDDFIDEFEDREVTFDDWYQFEEQYVQGLIEAYVEEYDLSEEDAKELIPLRK